ncbi:peptide-binding protein [Methylotenera sp.]|uniref:peptide-binding protein n=1 Tax=Methylotenera sp. TaxID=2051956 RepID=UPI0027300EC0|nr:peptide-binding protein [Methylotenera sp.]MDP2072141.1 peptide-binding protein [Methylotenera sp.]MDP2231685.1 peptide-binding protein [Methylotenera sp.]MDP3006848.1 peptide-binding protein [Methylotenera sp.]MDP3007215.1 peptide-binding protein [Methylotenera sp.]MDP3141315.1 peptide-binding protein [Methylotenera sp.]
MLINHHQHRSTTLALITLCVILTSACGDSTSNKANAIDYTKTYPASNGGTLINAMMGEPSGLIAMIAGESAASAIAGNIFNSLLKYDKNLELSGELAQSWDISDDHKTITFHLKPDLKWADNQPLTSEDVLFTWQKVTDENTRTPYGSDYKLVIKAETPDINTFRVTYAAPYAPALETWASLHILPKHLLKDQDINTTAFARNPIGSHYYKLEKWKNGQYLKLTRNINATQGQAKIDHLMSRIIPDKAAQFLELSADNIDSMGLNPIQYARIFPARPDLNKNIALYKELGNSYTYMGFNLKRKPFDDIRVRQAINYAINKQEIIDGVLLGLGEPVASPYKPGTRWSNPELKPYAYDPAKAKALLKEAGYEDHDGDGILDKDGKPFSFEILTNQNKEREMTGVLIQRRLKEIGIDANIRVLEWASFLGRFIKPKEFDVVVLGWSLSLDPDQYSIWHSSQQAAGQFNFISYSNSQVDKLLEAGRLELDPDKRMKIYHEFSKILLEDSPIVYLSAGYGLTAIHKRVKGISNPAPPAGIGHNTYEWYIPKAYVRTEMSEN